jgi:hypothetical protein
MRRDLVKEALQAAETYDREVAEDLLWEELRRRPDQATLRQVLTAARELRLRALEAEASKALRSVEREIAGAEEARSAAYGLSRRRTAAPPRHRVAGLVVSALIGLGGFGGVYLAHAGETRVAVRRFEDAFVKDPGCLARIRDGAARWIATEAHPNVVAARELREEEGDVALVMDYAGDRTLERLLEAGTLGDDDLVAIARDVCRAIRATGGTALDLRPSNVFVDEVGRARLSDVGLLPMAPGRTPEEPPSAVAGFGTLLRRMLSGEPPRTGVEALDFPLWTIVERCLGAPRDAFLTLAEIEEELARWLPAELEAPSPSEVEAPEVTYEPATWEVGREAATDSLEPLESLEDVEQAIAKDPGDLRLWQRRLVLQREARALRKTLGIGEEPAPSFEPVREGRAYLAFADPDEALRLFEAALAADPASAGAWEGRARALEQLGRRDEAAEAWASFEKAGGRRRT